MGMLHLLQTKLGQGTENVLRNPQDLIQKVAFHFSTFSTTPAWQLRGWDMVDMFYNLPKGDLVESLLWANTEIQKQYPFEIKSFSLPRRNPRPQDLLAHPAGVPPGRQGMESEALEDLVLAELSSNYAVVGNILLGQDDGTSIGSYISPGLAQLFFARRHFFTNRSHSNISHNLLLTYMDDGLELYPLGESAAKSETFLKNLPTEWEDPKLQAEYVGMRVTITNPKPPPENKDRNFQKPPPQLITMPLVKQKTLGHHMAGFGTRTQRLAMCKNEINRSLSLVSGPISTAESTTTIMEELFEQLASRLKRADFQAIKDLHPYMPGYLFKLGLLPSVTRQQWQYAWEAYGIFPPPPRDKVSDECSTGGK
jgi:hypothetical protein